MSAANGEALVSAINRLLLLLDARGVSANEIVACIKPLIADSEARAVAAAVTALTCTHHNDKQRVECPVCLVAALTAERDHWQKIAVSASQEREHNANVAQAMTAERDQLRAENERLKDGGVQRIKDTLATTLDARDAAIARAERAEAEAVLLKTKLERHCSEYNDRLSELRYAENMQRQAEAELATERARLDYMSTRGFEHRHHGNGDHLALEWTISSTNELKDVSLREVIDAAMQEDAR